jgi:hypothetical protein
MAALPLDFLSQLDELHQQEQHAREVLLKEREEVALLREMAVQSRSSLPHRKFESVSAGDEKAANAKLIEIDAAAAAAVSEKATLNGWAAANSESRGLFVERIAEHFSNHLELSRLRETLVQVTDQLAEVTAEHDEEK